MGMLLRSDDDDDIFRRALDFEVVVRRERGQSRKTWRKQTEEHIKQIGLKKDDATNRTKWPNGVNELSRNMR